MLSMFILVFLILVLLVQGVAYVTLCERHFLGGSQQRVGPNKVSLWGVVQPLFDGVKLVKKEQLFSFHSSQFSFFFVPGIAFLVMCLEWFVVCYFYDFFTLLYGLVLFLCLIGFSVYSFLLSGVMSKSKYGLIGALRCSNQSVSYEVVFSLYVVSWIVMFSGYGFFSMWSLLGFFFFVIFFVSLLAELNRAPFDFAEGESELVSGYNVEYGSVSYALLYMGEYGMLLFFSFVCSVLFFCCSFFFYYLIFCFFVFVRSSYPRFRYDMMMGFFWFVMLPLSLCFVFFFVLLVF